MENDMAQDIEDFNDNDNYNSPIKLTNRIAYYEAVIKFLLGGLNK